MRRSGRPSVTKMVSINDLESIARENPDVNIISSHMSKPFVKDLIKVTKRNSNIYTDISGLIDSKNDRDEIPKTIEEIREFLEYNGPSQLLFGTDFPVQTHGDSVYFIEEGMKGFDTRDKMKVYYQNARELLEK